MKNGDLLETSQVIHHSKVLNESYPKMLVLLIWGDFVKSYGHLSEILLFATSTHQIWLSHVTPHVNFENL